MSARSHTLIGPGAALVATLFAATVHAQSERPMGNAAYDSAYYAWEAGDYPRALATLERNLSGTSAASLRVPAALLTGELYATSELTRDGRAARWSPDGRHISYEVGTGAAVVTHILAVDGATARTVATLPGGRAVFGNGLVAYIPGSNSIAVHDLATGTMHQIGADVSATALHYSPDGALHYTSGSGADAQIYRLDGAERGAITTGTGTKASPSWLEGGVLVYGVTGQSFALAPPGVAPRVISGFNVSVSADRSRIAYVTREGTDYKVIVARPDGTTLYEVSANHPLSSPRVSPDGRRVVYQAMPREDWDIYIADGSTPPVRLTHDIMHDIMPQFVGNDRILAAGGEGRHRRSFIYDIATGVRTRVFHNNTVRTVAPEYEWSLSPDGTRVLIVSERDGDTVSPERGVYLVDLTREVTTADVLARVRAMRAAENDLRTRGRALYAPIAARVTDVVEDISKDRIYTYASDLFAFGSKYITQPGNAKAIEYIAAKLRSWGYEPELQYFEARGRNGGPAVRTANVIARLRGTVDQDATYVVSSHFDSVLGSGGADDDTSGTTALLEAARVLAQRPQPRTIEFAFFTGEEAGLLGSREYVRQAVAGGKKIVGALNNDMIGYANDQRLDNTIRYSNDGIRDIQHAAAIGFSDLITYDAKYYKNTDAHAYYDAYGDIVGGIGSYPILANPHYHQTHDVLETINQQLVAEVSKTTVATLMLLSASPSRLSGVAAAQSGATLRVTWNPAPESDVRSYRIEWGRPGEAARGTATVDGRANAAFTMPAPLQAGEEIRVKSVNAAGMAAWDWARVSGK